MYSLYAICVYSLQGYFYYNKLYFNDLLTFGVCIALHSSDDIYQSW